MSTGVRRIRPDERTEGPATAGMIREEAVATEAMWAGFVRTGPGMVSGWHHHGDFESVIFVTTGALVMEFGPGGARDARGPAGRLPLRRSGCDPSREQPDRRGVADRRRAIGLGDTGVQRRRARVNGPRHERLSRQSSGHWWSRTSVGLCPDGEGLHLHGSPADLRALAPAVHIQHEPHVRPTDGHTRQADTGFGSRQWNEQGHVAHVPS